MAGNPEDMTVAPYKDTDISHDHVYLGNGCSTGTGSETPCPASDAGGRIVKTADNEDQKNGTYYNYQAATVGTGSAVTAQYTNTPDTFCPLGWQLPYGGTDGDYYDKSRSWKYLLTQYNILDDGSNITVLQSYPLSYIRSGNSIAYSGILLTMGIQGFYWSISYNSLQLAYRFDFWYSGFKNNENVDKAHDQPLRCV